MNTDVNRTESLVREAFEAEAERAPDPRPVLAALAAGRRRRGPAAMVVAAAVAVVVAVAAVVVPQVLQRANDSAPSASGGQPAEEDLLLVGLDDHGLADSILLVHLDADGGAAALSLPRDSLVRVPGGGQQRLNAVDRELGTQALLDTVRDLTGVTVDHYGLLPMSSFGEISDALGGVEVCLDEATSDPMTGASFPAGAQRISGARALEFLRQRHGLDDNELDRMRRMQAFVLGVVEKAGEGGADLEAVLEVVGRTARLDPDWDLLDTASRLGELRPERLTLGTIPVEEEVVETPGNGTAFGVDPAAVRDFVHQAFAGGPDATSGPRHRQDEPQRPYCVN